jgi:hypothetical protein
VFFEVFIIGLGEITSKVYATAFLAHLGCMTYEQAGGKHILTFPAGRLIKYFIHHISLPESDDFLGICELLVRSSNAYISPHKRAK